jgi:hypothetical protein
MRNGKKRILSFFLTLVLTLQFTPLLLICADPVDSVWVNGVDVTAPGVTLPAG